MYSCLMWFVNNTVYCIINIWIYMKFIAKYFHQVLLRIYKLLRDTRYVEQRFPQVQYLVRHHQFSINNIVGKFMHRHLDKRVCFTSVKIDDKHFAISSGGNSNIIITY